MVKFREWCHKYARIADTQTGDFISDVRHDPRFPDVGNYADVKSYLATLGAHDDVRRAGKLAWINYDRWMSRNPTVTAKGEI